MGHKNTKKWVVLVAVATALLVIPRRSSRQADITLSDKKDINADNDHANHNHVD